MQGKISLGIDLLYEDFALRMVQHQLDHIDGITLILRRSLDGYH
jgi:peptide deformylase